MSEKIGEAVDGFGMMNARQLAMYEWIVTSWRNDETTAHGVDLSEPSCTCEDYRFNCEDEEVCDHVLKAAHVATQNMDVGEALNHRLLGRIRDVEEHVKVIERRAAGLDADAAHAASDASDSDTATSDDGGSDDVPDDGSVILDDVEPSADENGLREELKAWFNQAAGFNGFDGEIVDLTVTEIADHADHMAGERVIQVERQPFSGGYYDDGEWQDKDAFDEHKEACGDSILSPRDEFNWFGEPDYSYVIRVDDVSEVV